MKCLSVCQPWAWLIVNGYKSIENRTWATKHRGPLLIHAGVCQSASWKKHRFADAAVLNAVFGRLRAAGIKPPVIPENLDRGGIVGSVTLVDCIRPRAGLLDSGDEEIKCLRNPWFVGPVGWVLADQKPLPFHPLRGHLQVFEVLDSLLPPSVRE